MREKIGSGKSKEIIQYDNFLLVLFFLFFVKSISIEKKRRNRRKMGLRGGGKKAGLKGKIRK